MGSPTRSRWWFRRRAVRSVETSRSPNERAKPSRLAERTGSINCVAFDWSCRLQPENGIDQSHRFRSIASPAAGFARDVPAAESTVGCRYSSGPASPSSADAISVAACMSPR
ncbi:hypothetical protein WS70_06685 [Burkholderia mayonis]|uniref:Uncharacterized protein n=1 Tax=Burkholderia mayonis TaxID=1385591 RepID=A0A1B4FCX8_9BURK|nr:hypothetical protein WS70_06685 [Burkholderia mayonis]KVE44505.1 hypothetical protein WS69_20220 [Burkholderia sp. BDU5]